MVTVMLAVWGCIDLSNDIYGECDRGINTDEMEDLDRFQCKSVFVSLAFMLHIIYYICIV